MLQFVKQFLKDDKLFGLLESLNVDVSTEENVDIYQVKALLCTVWRLKIEQLVETADYFNRNLTEGIEPYAASLRFATKPSITELRNVSS